MERKRMDVKAKLKRTILFILLSVVGALLFEIVIYNFHPLISRDRMNINYEKGTKLTGDEPYTVTKLDYGLKFEFDEPVYIKKIQFNLATAITRGYDIAIKKVNMFGEEEDEYLYDEYNPSLGSAFTKINAKVKSIKLVLTAQTDWNRVFVSFLITNKVQINKIRVLFWFVCFFITFLFLFSKQTFEKKIEWGTAAVCLLFGCFVIYSQGINENGWDEEVHFQNIYGMSYKNDVVKNDAVKLMEKRLPISYYNTYEERSLTIQYANKLAGENEESYWHNWGVGYKNWIYLPQAIGILIARKLGFSFSYMIMFGKFMNLLCYTFIAFWTVRFACAKRELVAALFLIPTQMFIATTFAYDTLTTGFLMMGTVCWMRVMIKEKDIYTSKFITGCFVCFVLGSSAKAIYIPLILLCMLIPEEKFFSKRICRMFKIGIVVLFCMVLYTFVAPTVVNVVSNNIGWGGDSRVRKADIVSQMKNILSHPIQYTYLLMTQIGKSFCGYFLGLDGIGNYGRFGVVGQEYGYLTPIWICMIMMGRKEDISFGFTKTVRNAIRILVIGIVVLIWTALYLDYTPVGASSIDGVQARYYTPLLFPILLSCHSDRFVLPMKTKWYRKIILGFPIFLYGVGIYFGMLCKYCF